MASANWGTKRRCSTCGAAFYDLNRDPVICPKCHNAYVATPRVPVRGGSRIRAVEPPPPDVAEASAFEEDEILEPSDDDEDTDIAPESDRDGDDEEMRE